MFSSSLSIYFGTNTLDWVGTSVPGCGRNFNLKIYPNFSITTLGYAALFQMMSEPIKVQLYYAMN